MCIHVFGCFLISEITTERAYPFWGIAKESVSPKERFAALSRDKLTKTAVSDGFGMFLRDSGSAFKGSLSQIEEGMLLFPIEAFLGDLAELCCKDSNMPSGSSFFKLSDL